jgi:16S rRNA (cytidine1402-2'-O)-methyltransferase
MTLLQNGAALALVSDAGMPLVSDPGYRLVTEAIAAGHRVEAIPGASATLTALTLSGLPTDRFLFAGFLPHKTAERQATLAELKDVRATLIFFESPHRIIDTLLAIADVMGDRLVAVTRELTKLHEEILRGNAAKMAAILGERPSIKGEITLVVAPAPAVPVATDEAIDVALRKAAQELPAGQAAADVARRFGIGKREAYTRLLALRGKAS